MRYIFPHLKVGNHKEPVERAAAQRGERRDEAKGEETAAGASIDMEGILIVPTIQKSRVDTVRFGVEVEEEKESEL